MKRVLIFSLAYYPRFVSGAEVAIEEITDRISPTDIEFHMITLRFDRAEPPEELIGNVHVHRVGFGGTYISKALFLLLAAFSARALDRKFHFDMMWSVMTYMLFPVVFAKFFGVRAPYVVTLQDGDTYEKVFERWFIRPFTPLLDWGFRHAVAVQTISTFLATWPKKRGYTGEVRVIPNGASVASGKEYPEEELAELRVLAGKTTSNILLVTISRLVHQKGIDTVVRSLTLLPENVRLLIVGDGEDREMLEKLVDQLELRSRVVFTGQVDRTMTAKARKIADIFVSPSRSEGQGIAFVSTMIANLPIIATQEGGLADFMFDKQRNSDKETTAWVVDKDAPEQIAEAVKDIIAHPEEAAKVSATAKAYAKEHFDWDRIAKRVQTLLGG